MFEICVLEALLFKGVPKHMFVSARSRNAPYGGKCGLDKLRSGVHYSVIAVSSMLMNQQCILSKLSFKST